MRQSKYCVDGALLDFDKAISLDRNNVYGCYGQGVMRTTRANYDGAIADLGKAIKLDPNFAGLYEAPSRAWEAKGNHKRSAADRKRPRSLGAK